MSTYYKSVELTAMWETVETSCLERFKEDVQVSCEELE